MPSFVVEKGQQSSDEYSSRRVGNNYVVSQEEKDAFQRDGYVILKGVLSEDEMKEIETVYNKFMTQEIFVPGKDFCDMAGGFDRTPDQFSIVNAMLPRKYYPSWQGNVYELRTGSIAQQLCGDGMQIDYDQLLAKRPHKEDAIFPWHQDSAYWPPFKSDPTTATMWLAVDNSTVENGCMRFIPGSHKETTLRSHRPALGKTREEAHALVCDVFDSPDGNDTSNYVPIRRGDITVHNERVIHGSGPNNSDGWRRAYVVAYRRKECVEEERSMGFSHSHNDTTNWDTYHDWGKNSNNPHFYGARNKY
jgi:hypothetical protein